MLLSMSKIRMKVMIIDNLSKDDGSIVVGVVNLRDVDEVMIDVKLFDDDIKENDERGD